MSEEELGLRDTPERADHLAVFAAEMDSLLELPDAAMATRVLFDGGYYQVRPRGTASNGTGVPPTGSVPNASSGDGARVRLGFFIHIVPSAPAYDDKTEEEDDCELSTREYTPAQAAARLACYVDTDVLYERSAEAGWTMVPRIYADDSAVQLLAEGVVQLLNCPPPPDAPHPPPSAPPGGPPPPSAPPPSPFDWCEFALIVGPYVLLILAAALAAAFWAIARTGRIGKKSKKAAADLQWWARSWKVVDPKLLAFIVILQWLLLIASQVVTPCAWPAPAGPARPAPAPHTGFSARPTHRYRRCPRAPTSSRSAPRTSRTR